MKSLARRRWPSLHTRALCVLVAALFALPSAARAAGCGPHRGAPPTNGTDLAAGAPLGPGPLQHQQPSRPVPGAPCSGPTCSGRPAPVVPWAPPTRELKVEQRWAHPVALRPPDGPAPALPLSADEPLPLGGHPSSVYHPPR
jgi:hypothetical protein